MTFPVTLLFDYDNNSRPHVRVAWGLVAIVHECVGNVNPDRRESRIRAPQDYVSHAVIVKIPQLLK